MPFEGIFYVELFITYGGVIMEIDLRTQNITLNESYFAALGKWSKLLMNMMYPGMPGVVAYSDPRDMLSLREEEMDPPKVDFIIRGRYKDIKAYAQALGREHDYIMALHKYGEDHPITVKQKAEVDEASQKFTRLTGLEWPFK